MGGAVEDGHETDKSAQASPKKSWVQFAIGSIPLLIYVATGVTEGQISVILYTPRECAPAAFNAPFLYVWLKSASRLLMWGCGIAAAYVAAKYKGKIFSFKEIRSECENVTGPTGLTFRILLKYYVPAALSLLVMQAGYSFSLKFITASISMAIFTSTVAFSYLLSITIMKHKIYSVKLIFVVASFTGVAFITFDSLTKSTTPSGRTNSTCEPFINSTTMSSMATTDTTFETTIESQSGGSTSQTWIGILAILASAIGLAIHQILYARAFPQSNLIQSSFILTIMGIINTIIFFPVPLSLLVTGVESVDVKDLNFGLLIACLICAFIIGFVYGYGLGITTPFFMSLGELLNLGTNTAIDMSIRSDATVTAFQVTGLVLVAISFFVLIIPDEKVSVSFRPKKTESTMNMTDYSSMQ